MIYTLEDKFRNIQWLEELSYFWKFMIKSQEGSYFGALLKLYLIELNKTK